jgi:DNA-binding transcriptional regulator YiaG
MSGKIVACYRRFHVAATLEKLERQTVHSGFGTQVLHLRRLFGLTQKELSEMISTNERTIARWEQPVSVSASGALNKIRSPHPHPQSKAAISALEEMAEILSDLFAKDTIKVWIDRPNRALNNERPRDFAKKPGGIYRMVSLLDALRR